MNTKDIEEIVKKLRMVSNMINMGEKIRWGQETTLMDEAADMLEKLTQHHEAEVERAVEEERGRIRNEVLYDVDVEKIPSIQDEAWANQFDSKAEAFWYGQAQYRKDIVKDLDK